MTHGYDREVETYLFDLGEIEHATEWPPVPFDDSHHFARGLPGCFSCGYPQLLRHTGT